MIRFFDIFFSLSGLILASPIFFILSIWIKVDSEGPVFFRQERVGKEGLNFILLKFRSMFTESDNTGSITIGNKDPRITRSGYYLRRYKLDELPQLLNVLLGDMSLVGPRPEVRKYVDLYNKDQKVVLIVKPGITDYASIRYVDENELLAKSPNPEKTYVQEILPHKIELNMIFINDPSLSNYFRIILLTFKKIFD
ncbi:MAG TPA: sugar transferase [Ignavibacteria bacterium]